MAEHSLETRIALLEKEQADQAERIQQLEDERKTLLKAIWAGILSIVMLIVPSLPAWFKAWIKG